MKVGDRVRLSAPGRGIFDWASDADGTIVDSHALQFDWIVQWDSAHGDDYVAHYTNELEVIS